MLAFLPAGVLAASYSLNNNYALSWTVNGDSITVTMAAATTGWVGFGLGEPQSGAMGGADILIGYVSSDGKTVIQDSYALQSGAPVADGCQDWTLVSGVQAGGWTNITATRKLISNDQQDRPFVIGGQIRVLAAYGPNDDLTTYHDVHRWPYSLDFANPETPELILPPDVMYFDLYNNHSLSAKLTEYVDKYYTLPFTSNFHMIAMVAIVNPDTAQYVHHFVLNGGYSSSRTSHAIGLWTPNAKPTQYVPECGMRLGPGFIDYIWLNTHYNNPSLTVGPVDTSGVRIYYTSTMRPNDCGVIQFGDPNVALSLDKAVLPLGVSKWEFKCPSTSTNRLTGPVNLFGSALHMHSNGVQMWTTLNARVLNRVDFWDKGIEPLIPLNTTLTPGDELRTTCIYNTNSANVVFGLGSEQEMCIDFVFFWPRQNAVGAWGCGYKVSGGTLTLNQSQPSLDPRVFGTATGACAATVTPTPTKHTNAALQRQHLPAFLLAAVVALACVA